MIVIRQQNIRLGLIFLVLFSGIGAYGQQDTEFENLLQRIDTIENPVYKPVISIGYGVFNYMGDVKSSNWLPVIGEPAIKASISTFIDNNRFFSLNFYFLAGALTGNQQSLSDIQYNLNFKSNIYAIGAAARYEFGHLFSPDLKIRPYVSLGLEQLNFDPPKGDIKDDNGEEYHYWTDGTIRNISESELGAAYPLFRDYYYETNLRKLNVDNGGQEYSIRTIGIPLEIGFTLKISPRIFFNVGSEFHYTFSDYIDNVAFSNTFIKGDRGKDAFLFSHATLQFDMFSDPTTKTVDLLYADYEMDFMFFDDEDGDMVLDNADHCPGTPYGVITDTLGCPLDMDEDGVPDYLDQEPETPKGNWVDDVGVSLSEEDLLSLLQRERALKREDLEAYLEILRSNYKSKSLKDIPEKFKVLDTNGDGYISFEELLKMIDSYFDFKVNLSLEELREVNEFFFSQ
ncbi:hypothetical protein ACFLRQ_01470 [Bacteroidota bacterium]